MNTSRFPTELRNELDAGLAALGLDPALAMPLLAYLALLDRWNRTYNLTAIRDPREMVGKHLLDSLAMHAYLGAGSLADLGAGAGLPGIPLAIAKPALQVTLVESNGKKARFLREAVRTLGLANARVAESRAESLDEPGAYDAITARALATLPLIIELGGHLLKPGGRLLAMKGTVPDDEIAGLPAGWRVQTVHPLTVPGLAAERHLVVVGRTS
jgi:16S rRNA (guanine527-N7)-methyltransferase